MNPAELREMFRFLRGARALGAAEVEIVASGDALTAHVHFDGAPPAHAEQASDEPGREHEAPPADPDALGGSRLIEALELAPAPDDTEDAEAAAAAAAKAEDERTYWSA